MRQSLSNQFGTTDGAGRAPRGASGAVLLAIALTMVFAATAAIDQVSARSLSDHATALYALHAKAPRAELLYGLLYTVAGVAALLWLAALRSTRARSGFAALTILLAVTINSCLAGALLVSTEYGTRVFPPVWGVLAALPSAAGLMAVALQVRRR
jgi:hypothetical protein